MRARNIKPGFFKNEDLAECDMQTRLLFIGLWCMADREGRLEYRPKRIKAELFPYDNCNVEKLIQQLVDKRFIQVYVINEENFIAIINFGKHQHCHIKEGASTIPAPCKTGASPVLIRPITESPLPITESPLPETDAVPQPVFPDWLPQNTFKEYLSSKKKKIKTTSYDRFFAKLGKLSGNNKEIAEAILDRSIVNGWEGIFELPTTNNNQNKPQGGMFKI